jgi:methionyl-tRNA synthetase
MAELWKHLNLEGSVELDGWPDENRWLAEGHTVGKPPILFTKIEDEQIQAEKGRLESLVSSPDD